MSVDCVFWLKLPDGVDEKTIIAQWSQDVKDNKFPGANGSTSDMPEDKRSSYNYFLEIDQQQGRDNFINDSADIVVKFIDKHWGRYDCRYPKFAYCSMRIEGRVLSIHDGCRLHSCLNMSYQIKMLM